MVVVVVVGGPNINLRATTLLGNFINHKEPNLRYLGLDCLANIASGVGRGPHAPSVRISAAAHVGVAGRCSGVVAGRREAAYGHDPERAA
jgi:hypothetical protein